MSLIEIRDVVMPIAMEGTAILLLLSWCVSSLTIASAVKAEAQSECYYNESLMRSI